MSKVPFIIVVWIAISVAVCLTIITCVAIWMISDRDCSTQVKSNQAKVRTILSENKSLREELTLLKQRNKNE